MLNFHRKYLINNSKFENKAPLVFDHLLGTMLSKEQCVQSVQILIISFFGPYFSTIAESKSPNSVWI